MRRQERTVGTLVALLALCGGCIDRPPPPAPSNGGAVQTPDAGTPTSDGGGGGGPDAGPGVTPDGGPGDSARFELPPVQTEIPTWELIVPEQTLQAFHENPYLEEQPATFVYEGRSHPIRMRVRGGSSRWYPKKSWRLEFPQDTTFEGRRKINLVAEQADRTMLVEKLAYDFLAAMRVPAPGTKFVRLVINGRYEGLYLDIERVDKAFIKRRAFLDPDPTIYRSGNQDSELKLFTAYYQGPWQKKTNEDEPHDDLIAFLEAVNRGNEATFAADLEALLDLRAYLRSMVNDALISNDIVMDSGSYLVHDRVTGRWSYVPWDYNNSASRWWPTYGLGATPWVERPVPVFTAADERVTFFYERRRKLACPDEAAPCDYLPAFNSLSTRIYFHPQLRERFLDELERALDELFAEDVLHPHLEALHALIAPHVEKDPYVNLTTDGTPDPDGLAKFRESRQYLLDYVSGRAAFLRHRLAQMRGRALGVGLEQVDPNEGWLVLKNYGTTPVDLATLLLTTDLRRTFDRPSNLPAQVLEPGGTLRLTEAELGIDLQPQGELGLFTVGKVTLAHDVFFYGPLPPGSAYARTLGDAQPAWEVR